MSAPFVNKRVKVSGTSNLDLNNQEGRAVAYNAETMRYTVLLDNGRSVALKVSNLIPSGNEEETSGGQGFSGVQGMPGMPAMMNMLPSWLRVKLMRGEMPNIDDLRKILPSGVTPMHVGGIVVAFLLLGFKFGVFKTTLLFTVVGYILYYGFTPFSRASGGLNGAKAAGAAVGQKASEHIRLYTSQNLSPSLALGAVGIALAAVLYVTLATSSSDSNGGTAYHTDYYPSASMGGLMASDAYDKGYADGLAGKPHDWISYAGTANARSPPPSYQPSSPTKAGLFGGFSMGKLFSIVILGRQVYSLGNVPGGGGWNFELALANLRNQSMMQNVFMGLMVLRLFGMSPI